MLLVSCASVVSTMTSMCHFPMNQRSTFYGLLNNDLHSDLQGRWVYQSGQKESLKHGLITLLPFQEQLRDQCLLQNVAELVVVVKRD